MKSDRRHELQTNQLADKLAKFVEDVKPYTKVIAGGLVAAVVLLIAVAVVNQQKHERNGHAWNRLFKVTAYTDPGQRDDDARAAALSKVAQENPGTIPALWALMTEANLDLETGLRELFTNREDAREHLERARKNFERVEKEAARSSFLMQQAQFGLAQVFESLGDVSNAKSKYDKVAASGRESALGKLATERGKLLGEDEYKNFVEWFQKQKPVVPQGHPGFGGAGTSSIPGLRMDDLPQAPNLNIPGLGTDSTKKTDDDKPATDKPADDKPATEKSDSPKSDEPKADAAKTDKPAEKKPDAAAQPEAKSDAQPAAKTDAKPSTPPSESKPETKTPDKPAATSAEPKKDDAAPAKP